MTYEEFVELVKQSYYEYCNISEEYPMEKVEEDFKTDSAKYYLNAFFGYRKKFDSGEYTLESFKRNCVDTVAYNMFMDSLED